MKKRLTIDLENLNSNHIKKYNKIYLKKNFFVNYLNRFITLQKNEVALSSFFSRNNSYTILYRYLCYALLIEELSKIQGLQVKTQNYILFKFLKVNFIDKKISIIYNGGLKGQIHAKKIYFNLFKRLFFIIYYIYCNITARSDHRKHSLNKKKKLLLVDTKFIPSSFLNNKFSDRFFGNNKFDKVKKNIYFTPDNLLFADTKKSLIIMKRNKIKIIYRFDYLKLSDYLCSLFMSAIYNFNKVSLFYKYKNLDLSTLIKYDRINSIFNFNCFIGHTNIGFFKRLKEEKILLEKVINWNENQPSDKGFVYGVKKHYKDIRISGYAPYFANYNYFFDRQPILSEKIKNFVPDDMLVPSIKHCRNISKFLNRLKLLKGPMFRFNNKKNILSKKNYLIPNSVLVVLPIERHEAEYIFRAIQKIDLNFKKIYLSFHPDFSLNEINKFKHKLKKNFYICKKNIYKIISKVEYVVSSSSSTTIEALLMKKKIVTLVNSNYLIDSPLVNFYKIRDQNVAFSIKDLKYILLSRFDNKKNYFSNNFYTKINKDLFSNKIKRLNNFLK
jgi:hypothetical protein